MNTGRNPESPTEIYIALKSKFTSAIILENTFNRESAKKIVYTITGRISRLESAWQQNTVPCKPPFHTP